VDRPKPVATGAQRRMRRLIVPVALTVAAIAGAAVAVATSAGCGDDAPPADASVDAAPDTPIV